MGLAQLENVEEDTTVKKTTHEGQDITNRNLLETQKILKSQVTSAKAKALMDAEIVKIMQDPKTSWLTRPVFCCFRII